MYARRIWHIIGATFFFTILGNVVFAQSTGDWRASEEGDKNAQIKLEQNYHGVKPGSGNNLPKVEELKNLTGVWVTWPGFIMREDGSSRIFLQTTVAVEYKTEKTKKAKKRIVIKLKDARVHLSNNRNPLVTTHFNTPVKRVSLKKRKKSLNLVIELKISSPYQISQTTDEDGYHYLFVDFQKGDYSDYHPKESRPAYQGYGKQRSQESSE
jgi:hypothetical protein